MNINSRPIAYSQLSDSEAAIEVPKPRRIKNPKLRRLIAITLIIVAGVFYTTGGYLYKIALVDLDGGLFTAQFFRHSTSAFFLYVYARCNGVNPLIMESKEKLNVAIGRGILGFCNSILTGVALMFVHVTDFMAIYKSFPAFVLLFSACFMHERISGVNVLCVIIGFIGVIILVRPAFIFGVADIVEEYSAYHSIGALSALLGAVVYALIFLQIRKAKKYEIHSASLQFYHTVTNGVFCIIGKTIMQEKASPYTIVSPSHACSTLTFFR